MKRMVVTMAALFVACGCGKKGPEFEPAEEQPKFTSADEVRSFFDSKAATMTQHADFGFNLKPVKYDGSFWCKNIENCQVNLTTDQAAVWVKEKMAGSVSSQNEAFMRFSGAITGKIGLKGGVVWLEGETGQGYALTFTNAADGPGGYVVLNKATKKQIVEWGTRYGGPPIDLIVFHSDMDKGHWKIEHSEGHGVKTVMVFEKDLPPSPE